MTRLRILCMLLLCLAPGTLRAGELYATDFENFPVGDNLWAGTDGWISNDATSGAQGILQDFVTDLPLGKIAYLGFEPPTSSFTFVARPVNHDPAAGRIDCVEFESLLGVQDSTNGSRDQFFISFYDISGTFLASIVFDNTGAAPNVLRWKGLAGGSVESIDTRTPFRRGDQDLGIIALQILSARINLADNSWSAELDGIPLFTDAPFTDPAFAPLTLGSVAAEWELSNPIPAFAGDNWLLVADWIVRTAPKGANPFVIDRIERSTTGATTISWPGEPGFDYQVWFSDDLDVWLDTLPNSSFPGVMLTAPLSFTDVETVPNRRFYRVVRTVTP